MENSLRVTLDELEISPGKRARHSGNKLTKRSKLSQENTDETNFVKASKQMLQIAQSDTLKRLKLLYTPKCYICLNSATQVSYV